MPLPYNNTFLELTVTVLDELNFKKIEVPDIVISSSSLYDTYMTNVIHSLILYSGTERKIFPSAYFDMIMFTSLLKMKQGKVTMKRLTGLCIGKR